ncbi:hypothetical protein JYU20_00400 [Bacteroidales bacterium AH-315-I05]|nr:hypothetical protein [Bacteroidales bacterium AH-315-I05]
MKEIDEKRKEVLEKLIKCGFELKELRLTGHDLIIHLFSDTIVVNSKRFTEPVEYGGNALKECLKIYDINLN